jgi:hypothetical protein
VPPAVGPPVLDSPHRVRVACDSFNSPHPRYFLWYSLWYSLSWAAPSVRSGNFLARLGTGQTGGTGQRITICAVPGRNGAKRTLSSTGRLPAIARKVEPTGRANARPMMNSAIPVTSSRPKVMGFANAQPILRAGRNRPLADSKRVTEKHNAARTEYDRQAALARRRAPQIPRRKCISTYAAFHQFR